MKGLYRRANVWWLRFTVPGRGQVRVSTGETDEAYAINRARLIMDRPDLIDYGEKFSAEVAAYIAHKKTEGRSEKWRRNAEYRLNAALRHFGDSDPRRITTEQVRAWFEKTMKEKRPQTAATYFVALSRFMRWLQSKHIVRNNPCDGVTVPKLAPSVRRKFLTPKQARKILDECYDDTLKFCLYCALHAGLRKEEIIMARPSWFDLENGLLHVTGDAEWHPKDRDNRTIPLTAEFKKWLYAREWTGPFMIAPYIPVTRADRYRWDFRHHYARHLEACGIEGITFHDLRRTFASILASRGVSLYKIAKWLGDGHAVVERSYGHLMPNDDEINKAA